MSGSYRFNHAESDPGVKNGERKGGMVSGGLAYYDNATYSGPHTNKGSFSRGSDEYSDDTYRKKRSRCLIAIIIIVLLLVIGLAVFLGVYFGIMDKPDTVYKESQYEKGKFQTSMKINKPYDAAYANQNSPQYISMKTKLEGQLASMYQGSALKNDFQGVTVTGLSQGSIVVDYIITLNPNTVQTVSTVQQTTEQSVQQIKDDSSSSSDLIKAVDEVIVTAVIVSQTTTTTTTTTTTKAPTTTTTKATTTLVVTTEGAQPTTTTKATTAEVFTTEDAQPTTATSKAPTTISTKTTTEEDFTTEDAQPPTTTTKTPTTITTRATTEEDFTTEYAQAPTTTTKTPTTGTTKLAFTEAETTKQITEQQSTQSVVTEAKTITQSVGTQEQTTAENVITQDKTTTQSVVTPEQTTAENVITQDETTTQSVVTPEQTTAENVITQDKTTTQSVVTPEQTTFQIEATTMPPSDVPSVSLSKVSYSVASGSVTLECSVTSTLAVTNVFWQRQVLGDIETINSQTNITKYSGSSTSNPSLTILNALPSDEGSYVCFASSSGGQGHSGITKLSVTGVGNPCTDSSLLLSPSLACVAASSGDLARNGITAEEKCSILMGTILSCIINKIKTDYSGRTCTEEQRHNIIVNNREDIGNMLNVDPMSCLPTSSCTDIEAITYYIPVICESQINSLRSLGSCSDFSDALKCYYYHVGTDKCDMTQYMNTVSTNYTKWIEDIKKPEPNTCNVDMDWIDPGSKVFLCSDPDAVHLIVNMYCPNDLKEFISASQDDKCMKASNLVVCIEQQLKAVLKATCTLDSLYQLISMYQTQIIGVSNQPSIQDCHIVMTTPAEEMTTMEEAMTTMEEAMTTMDPQTTTATIVVVEGEFEANMKVNKTWDSKFEDKNSTEYKELTEKFRNQTLALYNYKNSSVEVEDIVILEVSKGSIVFVIVIILKKDSPNFRNWTSEKLIQETATIIEAVKKDPEVDNLDFVQTINTEEISVKEVTVVLTECDKNSYIKTIIHNSCDAALRRLTQVPNSQDRCRIFLHTIGCVVFNAQQCSVEKVTKTMTTHFQDIVSGVGTVTGFDPSSCYASVDTVVLPTMMPITSPVRPCVHPDVLSYILNFDCHYDAIPTDIEQGASMTEKCRFYWQSSACVYRMSKMNPLLQSAGACTYSDITSVLQQHASQMYQVKPNNVTLSDCYSYDRDQERCSSFLYDPEIYQDFDDCLYNVMKTRFDTKLDTANLTCVLYEEATECVFRYYKWKGLDSCVKSQFESDLIWMINMRAAQWSQMMGMDIVEPEITQKCISNSTSVPDFGHSICGDGRGLILSRTECISEILMSQPSDSVCRTFEDRYIPCIMEKLSDHFNCTSDDIKKSILKENHLITELSRGKVDLSSCMSMNETDICTSYKPEVVNFEDCSMAVYGFINKTVTAEVLCSGYNVFINCLSIKNGEKTGKMCKKSSLKTWLPVYLSAFTTVTETNIGACNVADDNVNYCNNVKEVETMAMVSGCTAFSQYLIHPSCQVWTPYIRCIAKMFPACRTDHLAYTLLNSSTIQGRVPQGYDVMESCFPSPDKTSSKFEITLTLDLPWKVEYADKNSQEYANFTRKVEEQVRALNQEYSSVIEYIKVIDVRSGSVVVVIEMKYYLQIKVSDISSGTAQMIMAANRDPSSQFDLIKAGDPYSIIIEPKGDDTPVTGVCGSYNARVMNSTLCAAAVYGFVNNTNVDQDLLCSAYNIYLNCLHLTVEKETGKDCKRSTLDTWMPAALPYMLNIPDSRFRSCDVDDDDVFLCGNVQLLEKMAFNSACAAYVQYLKSPSCSLVWTPYLKCIADIFPSCTINGVAQTLMTSANFSSLVPQDFDLITSCLPDESSSMFEITIKFDIPWKPEYSNTSSKEFSDLETRLVNQIIIGAGNNSAAIDYFKVIELREGSVIAVFLIKYYYLLKTSDIKSGTVQMILEVRGNPKSQLDLVKAADPDSVIVVSKTDDTTGSDDVCKVYSIEVMSVQTCIMALYGYMNKTNIDQEIFCRSYNIYLDCIHQTTEKNTDKKCARTSLNGWMPAILPSFLPNIQQSQIRSCNVNDEDLDSCHNTELIETMAMNSACFTGYGPSLQYPFCQIWLLFINCTAMTFPSCSIRDVAETLVKSNFTSNIPQGFDILTCLQDDTTGSDDVCKVLNIEVMSVQTCIMALYGFMNTTNIDQGIFCRSYNIYLDCIHHTVEENTDKKCARTSLNGWMPAILPSYLPNIQQSQIRSCNVNDEDLDSCHNTELIETMAMNSACFTGYGPSLQYPFCQIWLPFINCTAMSFPSCTIREVAETLVKSNFTSLIPQGFDILTCVPVERSNLFEITIKYNITWMPAYTNLASTEAMALETRLVQEIITYSGNTSAYFESLKVIELREGSVIAVFQLKYYNVVQLRTSEVKSGTVQMILQVRGDPKTEFDLLKVADPDSVIVKSKTDKNQTTDVCAVISENIVFPDACGMVWLSVYNKTNIDQDFLCSIYEIYLGCIQSAQEEKTGKECKRTSLASWIPNTILAFLPNIKDTQLRACSISNDKDICNDPKTLEVAAVNTTCSIAIIYFHFTPKISCKNVTDYFDCLGGLLPQCDRTDMVKKIVELPVFKAVVPDHFEALHCYGGGGDVCLNYTNYMYVQEEEDCTIAIGQDGQQDPFGLLCEKYNVYLSCVAKNIKENHQCEKFSLHTWLPGYIDKRYNISGADRCNVTNINYCNDIHTLELMINNTKCGYYLDTMASYPSCLNARMFLDCMTGLFPSCDEYMFAQTMVNSVIKNRIPQTFNPMACFGVSGPSKFVAEVKINATWDEDLSSAETIKYRQLKSTFEEQAWMLFSNKVLFLKDHIESIEVLSFKPGSIIVEFAVMIKMNSDFYKALQLEDFRQELLRAIKELKMNPPTAPNYFTSVDVDSINITGSDDGNQEVSTPSTTTLAPDCNSKTYISSIIDNKCGSAKSQLRLVDKDRKCSVLLDMIGCILFQTRICSKEQIVSTMSRDSWSMIGQNISVFDPISCFGPGNEVVLPTIVPLNVTLMPCVHPDVVHYILNYDCYYYGLQKQMQGDDKLDSCRMYWYSSACLYITLQTNKDQLGQCSLEEVNGVLTKYEDELFKVSPDNVTMSECLGLYKSADKCTRAMYSDDVFTIVQTCYGTAVSNRISAAYGIMDTSDYPCLIYQEMAECLYRPIKEYQLCLANETEVMEDHMIWLTNGFNDIMTIAMGSPLDERKTVETCIANVTKTPDFGQDLCDDGAGLIMSEITCLYSIGDQICNSLESSYIPCLTNGLSRKRIFCSAERIWRSLSVVSDLFGKLTHGRVDISSCNGDTSDKQGNCPSIGNNTVGICVEECSGDYNCTGDQKCCSNGCGHVCMDADSKKVDSGRFNITIRFDLDWMPEYREENSTFRTTLTNELNKIIASSELKAYLKYIRVVALRPGSIIAGCEAEFYMDITEHQLEMTLKTRIEEIQGDPEYTILQKWSNLSVETLPDIYSYEFEITIKFDIPWESEYTDKNSVNYQNLTREILKQMAIISGDFRSSNIASMKITELRQGSVYVVFEVIYYYQKTTSDVRSGMLGFVTAARMDPKSELDLIKAVDTDHIYVRIITAPDCKSMTYVSSILDSQCDSAKSQLRLVDKDRKCSVLLDMIGCVLFQTGICNKEQIVSTMSMDSWSMIGQNISVFDPISCLGPGNEVVLPTIVPLNVTLMPCVHPDVVHYILNYDCYYYGLQKQIQGDDKLDSCRMYWYSSACLYRTLQTNKNQLGQCSLEEVNGVLTKYEDELFKVSPDNVTMSECLGLYKSADKCTRAMYSEDVFTIVQTCYGTAVANRITAAYGIMDTSDYPCLIYQEMSECLYRPIKEHQLCLANETEVMEDHMIWLTNGLNDIMSIAMGSPLDERKTVETCIANVTKTPDFGQDLCDDGAGLIMSEITCLYSIGDQICNSLESAYIPCLTNGLSRKRIFCSAERIWRSLSVVGDLFGKLTYGRVDISSCNRDTSGKQGTCPAVGNHTVGICVEECSGDYNCTGDQKCCSNGCGHVCMDPDSNKDESGRFNITIRFDLDWKPEYREENSTFRTTLSSELNRIIASSELKAYLKYIRVVVLRPGSIIAGCEAEFDMDITEHQLEMTLKTRIEEIQDDPEYTILQKWSNLSVEILPESEDVCTDVTKIARELQVCSSYLNYTQHKDNRTNCGLYNYFLNCVVSSVTANRQKCTRDSLEGIMQTVFESIGRSDLKALLNCSGQGSVYFRADLEYMKRVIRSHFSDTRHHAPQYSAYKQTAKQFIFDEFQRFGLDTEYHTFNDTEVSSTATFQSVIGVLKGTRFGTADDLISGLGAHYDTVNTSKGVDDNGSGVAAMLEVVRQITNINNSGYKSKNTIIFVSFDLEEYGGLSGSRNFLQDWLTPWLIKNYGSTIPEKLQGVIILDTIMEYNTSNQSQVFPLGALDQFQQFFPSAVESILSDDARGDFISLIYRQPTDDRVLAETFDSSWAAAGRSEFEIESFPLPFADLSSVPQENLALMYQFLRSDHANFWGANLPAIFLTDSANFRGDMIQCYHNPCDDLDTMLTDDNVNFLGKIADTVTATIHRLSEPFIPEDVDGICEDSMLMELIVNQSCTSYLQGFQNQSSCQALSSMVDRCLSPLMPGVTCDRNRMLSHVVTMVMVAKMLPVGFNISTCGSANHSNNAKQSISDMCLGQWGSCASQQDCHMVTWSYNLNTQMISFNVTAAIDSDKWMGVGFNGQKEMAGSDALVGWITPQATVTVTDRNNPSYYGSFLDTTQNVKNAAWERMNGITSISFQRDRDTNDTSDFIFSEDNCAYFIYPIGGSYNENDKSINRHSKTPTISLEQFCFPCADVCTSKELFRKMGSTECKFQVDSFKESDDFLTFCGKLQRITECLQTNLPTHGCSSTIKDSTYPVLITLLSELVGFDTMSKAISCSSAA